MQSCDAYSFDHKPQLGTRVYATQVHGRIYIYMHFRVSVQPNVQRQHSPVASARSMKIIRCLFDNYHAGIPARALVYICVCTRREGPSDRRIKPSEESRRVRIITRNGHARDDRSPSRVSISLSLLLRPSHIFFLSPNSTFFLAPICFFFLRECIISRHFVWLDFSLIRILSHLRLIPSNVCPFHYASVIRTFLSISGNPALFFFSLHVSSTANFISCLSQFVYRFRSIFL